MSTENLSQGIHGMRQARDERLRRVQRLRERLAADNEQLHGALQRAAVSPAGLGTAFMGGFLTERRLSAQGSAGKGSRVRLGGALFVWRVLRSVGGFFA